MSNELYINSAQAGVQIALVRDKKLIELHQEGLSRNFSVGDIYLGQIRKITPGLNAAFVNVGYEKDAFLHYLDLGPQIKSLNKFTKFAVQGGIKTGDLRDFSLEEDIVKSGKINEVLTKNNPVLVQVVKEPISSKGPRISSQISLPGRYMVLIPFSSQVSVSKKIKSFEERTRLKNLANSIKPANFGVIVRTVAEGRSAAELHQDLLHLTEKWETVTRNLKNATAPSRVLSEVDRASSLLRDILNDNFSQIVVNDQSIYDEIKSYITQISPDMVDIVKFYSGKVNMFDQYGVEKQIKSSFGKNISLQGGSYLIVEHTEALHVIDVNSGSKSISDANQEENALNVNMEACAEIARQLRLRDMGGIIVVDFIDQRSPSNKRKVYEKLKEEMKTDRAKHNILPMSKFGLVQITRQRVRPEVNVSTSELCPTCKGSGEIGPSILITDEIEQRFVYLLKNLNLKNLTLVCHPFVEAYLKKGLPSLRMNWYFKHKSWLKVISESGMGINSYRFDNEIGEEINL